MVSVEVSLADLISAGLRRELIADAGPTRAELDQVCSIIMQEAMKK